MVDIRTEDDIERLRQVAVLQDAEIGFLHQRITAMSAELEKAKKEKQGRLQRELKAVQQHLAKLQKIQFGASSEKRKKDEKKKKKKQRRRRSGPRQQPDLDVQTDWFELDEADKICPGCGDPLDEMGECSEDSEMIDVIERKFVLKKVKRQKYTCRGCGHIDTALGPDKLRKTRRYSPEVAIEVAINKYLDHLPLARQVRRMERQGLRIDTQTLWDQLDKLADHIETTYLGIKHWIFGGDVMGMDETSWPLMKKGNTKTWQMWAMHGRGASFFAIRDSRSGKTAIELLHGFSGWLITDGYQAYPMAVRESEGNIRLVGCWAHVRRKFIDAEKNNPALAEEALDMIGELYEIESRARDPDEGWKLLEWCQKLREEESKPVLNRLKLWSESQSALPRSNIGKAIKYMRAMWPRLVLFADHPELWIDNNPTERGIRGPVVGRKNFYGSRSRRGTEVAAMLYTICETAKVCGVNPRDYLRRVVMNDIKSPHTVTLPRPIEEVMADE
jgi:transposase